MKLGIHEAAKILGKSDNTIRAYLSAWNAAAKEKYKKKHRPGPMDGGPYAVPGSRLARHAERKGA